MEIGSARFTSEAIATQAVRSSELNPRLVSAAHQFEASLMKELLKPLRADGMLGDEQSAEDGTALTSSAEGSGSALTEFGSEAMARALSEKGGFGIAKRVLENFAHSSPGANRFSG